MWCDTSHLVGSAHQWCAICRVVVRIRDATVVGQMRVGVVVVAVIGIGVVVGIEACGGRIILLLMLCSCRRCRGNDADWLQIGGIKRVFRERVGVLVAVEVTAL